MSAPQRYRKKPVVIEAMRYGPNAVDAVDAILWVKSHVGAFDHEQETWPDEGITIDPATGLAVIATLEGPMRVGMGDWIIRGVEGEFYPCKPGIFDATYEPVVEVGS